MELTLYKLSEKFLITSNNNLITSNEKNKIEVNDPFLHITNADYSFHICIDRPAKQSVIGDNGIDYFLGNCKKVIAQQDQIDFSALKLEDQKEIGWFDFLQLGNIDYIKGCNGDLELNDYLCGYSDGFQKHAELTSDRRFTLEDIAIAFRAGIEHGINPKKPNTTEYIQSISQPKSWKIDGLWENNKFKITKIL
jgi:hypothetical protein